jgi:hypothetical protein
MGAGGSTGASTLGKWKLHTDAGDKRCSTEDATCDFGLELSGEEASGNVTFTKERQYSESATLKKCHNSIKLTGTFKVADGELKVTFASGTGDQTGCAAEQDNSPSKPFSEQELGGQASTLTGEMTVSATQLKIKGDNGSGGWDWTFTK